MIAIRLPDIGALEFCDVLGANPRPISEYSLDRGDGDSGGRFTNTPLYWIIAAAVILPAAKHFVSRPALASGTI